MVSAPKISLDIGWLVLAPDDDCTKNIGWLVWAPYVDCASDITIVLPRSHLRASRDSGQSWFRSVVVQVSRGSGQS